MPWIRRRIGPGTSAEEKCRDCAKAKTFISALSQLLALLAVGTE